MSEESLGWLVNLTWCKIIYFTWRGGNSQIVGQKLASNQKG